MPNIKLLTAAAAFASIGLTAPFAMAHDHDKDAPGALHESPAEDAGGTPGEQGVGGSIEVPDAGPGSGQTSPYDEFGEDLEVDEEDPEPDTDA